MEADRLKFFPQFICSPWTTRFRKLQSRDASVPRTRIYMLFLIMDTASCQSLQYKVVLQWNYVTVSGSQCGSFGT
jgi:hypothetical protein